MSNSHLKRSASAVAATVLLTVAGILGSSPAEALAAKKPTCYPTISPDCPIDVTISLETLIGGQSFTVIMFGLDPGAESTVSLKHKTQLGQVTVAADGTATFTLTAPEAEGTYTLTVSGTDGGKPVARTVVIKVEASGGVTSSAQIRPASATVEAREHDVLASLGQAGIALVAIGGGIAYGLRRRHPSH
jgi:hypothetical protein